MSLLLEALPEEEVELQGLGAQWDSECKRWVVLNRDDYEQFDKWLYRGYGVGTIVCNHYYIVEAKRKCHNCREQTTVVAFGADYYYEFADPEEFSPADGRLSLVDSFSIFSSLEAFPDDIRGYLRKKYNVYIQCH
jgi:hypothetical protein